jgi:hypothetical protein
MRPTGPVKAGHYSMLWVVLLTISPLADQQPIVPPPQQPIPTATKRGRATQHNVAVRGCVRNGRLRMAISSVAGDLSFETLNVSEFVLDGPKELLQQIKELHNGHYDEIEGIATVPPPPQDEDVAVVSSKKGQSRITAGRRDEKGLGVRNSQTIRLRVASLTHFSEGCVERP